ncbi:MAG: glycerate kinase [Planctomycetota bacterium]
MRVLIAPDKFKGTLTAKQAAAAMAEGVRRVWPDAEIVQCPMSDGGEGFVDVLCDALDGRRLTRTVTGPLPDMRVDAEMGLLPDGTTVIEMASAAGLALLREDQRNPMNTTTFGVGELIRFAVGMDARHVILGLGGSATIDAGIGCLQALGCPITLEKGQIVTADDDPLCGRDIGQVIAIGRPGLADGLALEIACDVTTRLTDAARTFGPQKGATTDQVDHLDTALRQLAKRLGNGDMAGTGAAGGLGWGLSLVLDATLTPGIELIGNHGHFMAEVSSAQLVLTGEGCYDATSSDGKVVGYVELVTRAKTGVDVIAFCGSRTPTKTDVCEVVTLTSRVGKDAALAEPARHLADAVAERLASSDT